MNCNQIESLWIDYFDDALDGVKRREVEGHLGACEKCTALVAEMRSNRILGSAIPEVEPPPRMIQKIIAQTSGTPPASSWYDFIFDFIRPQQLPKFAMGSVMAVASLAIVLYAAGFDFNNWTAADLTPSRLWERTNREAHLAYSRGVKYYNALRIVYEIQSRIESLNASTRDQEQSPPDNPESSTPPAPKTKPSSQHSMSEERRGAMYLAQNLEHSVNFGGLS
jgi:hypothetical protein